MKENKILVESIKRIIIFGSSTNMSCIFKSYIDIYIEYKNNVFYPYGEEFEEIEQQMYHIISKVIQVNVYIVTYNKLVENPQLKYYIDDKTARIIYNCSDNKNNNNNNNDCNSDNYNNNNNSSKIIKI